MELGHGIVRDTVSYSRHGIETRFVRDTHEPSRHRYHTARAPGVRICAGSNLPGHQNMRSEERVHLDSGRRDLHGAVLKKATSFFVESINLESDPKASLGSDKSPPTIVRRTRKLNFCIFCIL
eukprot:Polyplicarium_translucidae@DN3309_c0_g2_i6.p2